MISQRGSSPFPPSLVEDQKDIESFPSNSLLCPIIFNPSQDHGGGGSYDIEQLDKHQHHHFLELAKSYDSHGGSIPSSSLSSLEKDSDHEFSLEGEDKDSDQGVQGSPVGWMSSKMRFMMKYDQKQPSSSSSSPSNTENVRVCTDCNTTKTPLWRSGPKGPKSLCNACGIRQRKARRAIGTATAGTSTSTALLSTGSSSKPTKTHYTQKKPSKNHVAQYKKQSKLTPRRRKKLGFEEFIISLSNNSAFHQVFPQDETEAAILLMALSCGLVSD